MVTKPFSPTAKDLAEVFTNPRMIRAFQLLFQSENDSIDSTEELLELVNGIQIEAGSANARAQEAIDMLLAIKNCGSFYDTTDQVALAISTPVEVTFNSERFSQGISIDGSRINVSKSGTYNFHYTLQLED